MKHFLNIILGNGIYHIILYIIWYILSLLVGSLAQYIHDFYTVYPFRKHINLWKLFSYVMFMCASE